MPETKDLYKKEGQFFSLAKWKKEAIKDIAEKEAINLSQLVENLITEHFKEKLIPYEPENTATKRPAIKKKAVKIKEMA